LKYYLTKDCELGLLAQMGYGHGQKLHWKPSS